MKLRDALAVIEASARLCAECGGPFPEGRKSNALSCSDACARRRIRAYTTHHNKARAAARAAEGLCVGCGKKPRYGAKLRCKRCLAKLARRQREVKWEALERGEPVPGYCRFCQREGHTTNECKRGLRTLDIEMFADFPPYPPTDPFSIAASLGVIPVQPYDDDRWRLGAAGGFLFDERLGHVSLCDLRSDERDYASLRRLSTRSAQ